MMGSVAEKSELIFFPQKIQKNIHTLSSTYIKTYDRAKKAFVIDSKIT